MDQEPLNVCLIGHGMMGRWHSEALSQRNDCCRHTLVGRRPEPTAAFAAEFGYGRWTTDLCEALNDTDIAVVIVAGPSEHHAEMALDCLSHGKHVLVEIPIAMSLKDAEEVVYVARDRGLTLGVVHPVRFVDEMIALRERVRRGEERVRQVVGRFYTHRLENVGITGYRRSWTDNILWHHTTHLLDFAMWLVDCTVRKVHGFMPPVDPKTGIPMDVYYAVETIRDQSLIFVGSYYGKEQRYEVMTITDRDSYNMDMHRNMLVTGAGPQTIDSEKLCNARVVWDFLAAVREGCDSRVAGPSVLPAMRILQQIQDQWDRIHGAQSILGRPLPK